MKKAILFLSAALVALAACDKYEKDVETTPSDNTVTFKVSVSNPDDTKAVKSAWANGDKIYVFFENIGAKWLVLTYNGSTWDAANGAADFVAGDFSTLGTKELTAVHTPADVTVAWDSENSKFTFTDNSTNSIKPIYNYYLLEEDKPYTVDDITVDVTLAMGKPADYVWFYVDGISANVDQFYLRENSITPTAPASVALAGGVTEATKTTGYPLAGVALSTGGIYAGKVGTQTTYGFQLVKVHSASDMIATRTYTKAGTATFAEGKQYNLGSYTSMTENQWVDLQFPSNNVLWATGNLTDTDDHASPTYKKGSIIEYDKIGRYYAWAETVGRSKPFTPAFSLENAPYYDGSAYTKYNSTDKKSVLEETDDAAYRQLDGENTGWRMPKNNEMLNLVTYGVWQSSPIWGWLVTGPNSLKLFLKHVYHGIGSSAESHNVYWTSQVTNNNLAQRLFFRDGDQGVTGDSKYYGGAIRPVKPVGY